MYSNLKVENCLISQKISGQLQYSKVLLVKAMEKDENPKNYAVDLISWEDNKISSLVAEQVHFKIVNAYGCSHWSIGSECDLLQREITSFQESHF